MKNQKGQIIPIYAILFVTVLSISGFIFDAGSIYVEKTRTQTIIKEALIAGSKYLPDDPTGALNEIRVLLEANGENYDDYNVYIRGDQKALAIVKDSTYKTVFWSIVGINRLDYTNEEIIEIVPAEVNGIFNVPALALGEEELLGYEKDKTFKIELKPDDDELAIVRFYSDLHADIEDMIRNGYNKPVYLNERARMVMGNYKDYYSAFKTRLESDPIIYIPIFNYLDDDFYDDSEDEGYVIGFAKLEMKTVKKESYLEIHGEFLGQSVYKKSSQTNIPYFDDYERLFIKNILPESRWW